MVGLDLQLTDAVKYVIWRIIPRLHLPWPVFKVKTVGVRKYHEQALRLLRVRYFRLPGFPAFDLRSVFTLIMIARLSIFHEFYYCDIFVELFLCVCFNVRILTFQLLLLLATRIGIRMHVCSLRNRKMRK